MFKPCDFVTFHRDTGTHDFITTVFLEPGKPYRKVGKVTGVMGDTVYVWWNGTSIMDSPHNTKELCYVK